MRVVISNAKNMNRHIERKRGIDPMSSNRILGIWVKTSIAALALAAFVWAAPTAQAGAIRYAGKMILQGTNAAAAATASGGEAAADRATSAARTTGGVLGNAANATGNAVVSAGKVVGSKVEMGAGAVAFGAKQAPHTIAHKTTAGARSLWHAIW